MRTLLFIVTAMAVIALAFWAYRENYATQGALAETRELRREIRDAHERLSMLKAEWAYLNRPDRLRELAAAEDRGREARRRKEQSFQRIATEVAIALKADKLVFIMDNGQWRKYVDGAPQGSGSYTHNNGFANTRH